MAQVKRTHSGQYLDDDHDSRHRDVLSVAGQDGDHARQETAKDASEASTSDVEEAEEKQSLVRRHPFWILGAVLLLAVAAVIGYFLWLTYYYPYETTDDAFVDARSFSVATKVSGYLDNIDVADNQHVAAGAVIARIVPAHSPSIRRMRRYNQRTPQ